MTQNPTPEHQTLVRALINHFRDVLGLIILSADLPEFTSKPFSIGGHFPDIVARDPTGILNIGEAKFGDDIFSQNTKEELLEFSKQKMKTTSSLVPLHVVVYKYEEGKLINTLNNLGLGFKIGNQIKIWTL